MINCDLSLLTQPSGVAPTAALEGLNYDDRRYYPTGPAARERLRAEFGFRGKVVLALAIGPAAAGLDALIDAFGLVARRDPSAILHLAAIESASSVAQYRDLVHVIRRISRTPLLQHRVRLAHVPAADDRANLFRAADVFAVCGEGQAAEICALEAMACGTPAVLSVHGALQRTFTFGRHALHADPSDPVDFGLTLMTALRDPRLWMRLARMGAHQARSFFTLTGLARCLEMAPAPEATGQFPRESLRASA